MHRRDAADTLLFTLPSYAAAESLVSELGSKWRAWIEPGRDVWIVGAELGSARLDLAVLLRRALAWAAVAGVADLVFDVDGRSYSLPAPCGETARTP